jgi:hypothetical protein
MTQEENIRFILNSYPNGSYIIQTVEISHPDFSQVYYLTDESEIVTATIESGLEVDFLPTNFEASLSSAKNDLDQNFAFSISDVDNKLDDELSRIPLDNTENIVFIYRAYSSDDLSGAGYGAFKLQVFDVAQKVGSFTVTAGAKQLNWSKTGKIYDYDSFPMLRAFK